MKKKGRKAFSLFEVVIAVAIFSIAAVALATSMANGLLCRRNVEDHDINSFEYAFVSHIVRNSESIYDATRLSNLSLPNGRKIETKIVITPTDLESLFLVDITINGHQYKSFFANKNWQ
ncbi:MAG: type II secretion system GspH family protein [Puniceicoccales bacterium]|jgi:prepilin-type N-terminal cleavage/methylation domain-containing protein|nr:type II secretion system GspH family protein [Puniceicoccales bacterium]